MNYHGSTKKRRNLRMILKHLTFSLKIFFECSYLFRVTLSLLEVGQTKLVKDMIRNL